ncbi:hypothetical protein [Actinoplanes solisilvae]|uniref:hypothetical protein n=1 Tax=Actinoplanes solisilvae TaxID=2486853 RepID=UPI000FD6F866|nr:hypothetical protein [Actinoplanes solisilvae]
MQGIQQEIEGRDSVRAVVVFALCCGERSLPVCRLGVSDPAWLRACLDRSWAALADGSKVDLQELSSVGSDIRDSLEDADYGRYHMAVFDAITVIGHAVSCAGQATPGISREEAKMASAGMLRMLQGVHFEQYGRFDGWQLHESVSRELAWQKQDLALSSAETGARSVEATRIRASRQGQMLVDGVVSGEWSGFVPPDDWPTLF